MLAGTHWQMRRALAVIFALALPSDSQAWHHGASAVQHLTINLLWDTSVSGAPAGFKPAITACATTLSNLIVSNTTVSVNVGWGEVNGITVTGAGASFFVEEDYPYATMRTALIAAAKSANAINAVANGFPASNPSPGGTGGAATSPNGAVVLGLFSSPGGSTYGYIGLNSGLNWNYTLTTGPTEYDIQGTCLHEMTEQFGRAWGAGSLNFWINEYYRYTAANTRIWGNYTSVSYFSIDSGTTNLRNYNQSSSGDSDWSGSSPISPFNETITQGVNEPLTSYDMIMIDVLGMSSQ